eukprot:CAMPEP_0197046204 /NCGR_PEP_ID=MMETSP1384-20130603/21940_1 /TAXON_ID=29189 /ORGANISM="Ammonia sp." /LENGTH=404 /DNA_ID=CAMNT_0042477949 /DNA_START=55 /DNA_END=1269 /DNA_ORIENTATION=-
MGQSTSLSLESDDDYLENEKIEQQQKRRSSNEQLLAIPVESTSSTITSTLPVNTEGRNTQKNEAPSGDAVNKHEETVPIRPDDDHKEEEKTQPAIIEIDTSQYAVNYAHLQVAIKECTDCIPTTEQHSASKLVAIFEKLEVSSSDCSLWQIGSKQSAKSGLQSVVTYTEQNAGCSPEAKTKLRVITKLIMDTESDKQSDYKHIFLLIASHGTVCNVMKEVAIAQAYGMMTNNLREYIESQSLQQQVLRVLRDYRVLLSEQLFHRFKFCNNTHYIAGWNNTIAAQIGVPVITDPNICYPSSTAYPNWKTNLDKMFLKTMYTTENILKHIAMQIDEKKIGYQKIVSFLEQHCPKHVEKSRFLHAVIDIDTGAVSEEYMFWLLHKLDIFVLKDEQWKEIEKCWEYDV